MPALLISRNTRHATVLAVILLLAVAALYYAIAGHWHERLAFLVDHQWTDIGAASPAIHLDEFHLAEIRAIPAILDNLSGLAFDVERGHLWAVTNDPTELFALGTGGEVLGRYPLRDFHDTEGVAFLGGGWLAIVEERRAAIVLVPVPLEAGIVERGRVQSLSLALGREFEGRDNNGLEGVAYDRIGDRLFLAKERNPRGLYSIKGLGGSLAGHLDLAVEDHRQWVEDEVFARDLSSLAYDPESGHLVLLSHESRLLLELSDTGEVLGMRSLGAGFAGLEADIPQPEGVAFDAEGNLYIVSEPNLFYRFERR